MKKLTLFILGGLLALAPGARAQTAVWTNTTGGSWITAGNWLNGFGPGPGTNVSINSNGTYTVTMDASVATNGDVTVGANSTLGLQTLNISSSGSHFLLCPNITVGANGRLVYQDNAAFYGTGLVTVASGGQLCRTNGTGVVTFDAHNVAIQGGGQWTIASGAQDQLNTNNPSQATTYTIDGTLNGPGTLSLNNSSSTAPNFFTGTGRLDVAQITLNGNNGRLYLGGSLTVNSMINQTGANGSTVTLTNGAMITLNGSYQVSGGGSVLLLYTNTDSATLTGTNQIYINHSNGSQYMYLSGTKVGDGYGGTLTIAGTGELDIQQTNFSFYVKSKVLNLQRNTRIWGGANAKWLGPYNSSTSTAINVGAGATLTLDTNCILHLERFDNTLNVTNGANLAMRQAILEGGSLTTSYFPTNVCVGCGSPGTFILRANSTNVFRMASTDVNTLCVLLGSNATATAEAGSVLQLQNSRLAVGITNSSAWGWNSAGTIEILSNSYFEAMSTDKGTNVLLSNIPFSVQTMRFTCAGNLSNTLWNAGSVDNDGDGTNDSALYVGTLDLSGMSNGTSVGLGGSGIAAPKLYYVNLITNGLTVALGANILALGPQTGTLGCVFTNSPIPAGAQWRLTSGADMGWKNSGDTVVVVPATYTQTFQTIPSFLTPSDLVVAVSAGQVTNTQVGYITNVTAGSVLVTLQPAGAVAAGAQWRLTAGPQTNWQASGATVAGLPAGSYTVTCTTGVPAWYTPADTVVTVAAGATTTPTVIYAAWPTYGLTIQSAYGAPSPGVGTGSYVSNTVVTCQVSNVTVSMGTTQYVCTGWTRIGSSGGAGNGTSTVFAVTTDTTQIWAWATNYYLQTSAGSGGSVDQNGTWPSAGSNVTITATPSSGYGLAGWGGDVPGGSGTNNPLVVTMDRPRSITVQFAPLCGLTIQSAYGTPSPAVGVGSYLSNTVVTCQVMNATVTIGTTQYVCAGWTRSGSSAGAGSGTSTVFPLMSATTQTWAWATNYYLQTSAGLGGTADQNGTWPASGSNVTITAAPASGYVLVGWGGDAPGGSGTNNPLVVTMDRPRTITVQFAPLYGLTVQSAYGTPSPAVGTGTYVSNSVVTCQMANTAVTAGTTQYVCTGWTRTGSGAGAGNGTSAVVSLTTDTTQTWVWATNYYLQTSAGLGGTVDQGGTWQPGGSNVTITATPMYGYAVSAWGGDAPGGSGTNNPLVMTMDRPRNISVAFAELPVLTAVWTNTGGGLWSALANWQNNQGPGPGMNVDINANGTYTNTVSGTNACVNIMLGTTSSFGTQTLAIYGSAPLNPLTFSNMTVGALGVLSYANNSSMNGTGLVTVASGGQLWGNGTLEGGFGGHDILVQGGGRWTTAIGATNPVVSDPGRSTTFTINGTLDGPGTLNLNNSGIPNYFTGTGRLDVAQITLNANNGNLYLGGTLTLNSTIIQSNANGSAVVLTNGSIITLNGPYMMGGASSALLVYTNTDSATITGTNLISVRHDDNGNYGVFTGTKVGSGTGGNITIAGSGVLNVYQASTLNLRINAAVLNLQRNSSFWATTNAAAIRPNTGSVMINANGPGTTMTLDTNIILRLWSPGIILNVTNGASLAMRNAIVEGGNNSGGSLCTNVFVGCGSAATLTLKANSTNTFRQSTEDLSPLCVLLGPSATVTAETGSVLQLQNCHFAVGITNSSAWGWNSAGTIEILSNSYLEAMSSDRGTNVLFSSIPFGIQTMRFTCPGSLSNTLFNGGSNDNDGDGSNDVALYVGTLDLSGMASGVSAVLGGAGIAAPKLYYVTLINPNGITLPSNILALGPQNATVGCTITNSPVPAGAQWRLTSGPDTGWKNSGDAVSLAPGVYTQTFQAIQYFLTPPDLALLVYAGQTTNTQVGYPTNTSWGSVQVTIQPAGAVTAGAQWRLTTGPQTNWQASGATVQGLAAGSYTVTYMTGLPAWITPSDDPVTVSGGATAALAPTYASTPVYALTVASPYGSVTPPVGVTSYLQGTPVTCAVNNSPITLGTTQYVCTGWTRTGSSAGSGAGTNSTFFMTADTVQAWQWQTNYFLQTSAGANGTVDMNGTWWRAPSNATVTASPGTGYQLAAWSGDVPSGSETSNPLVMPMDRPRSVTAIFAPVMGQTAIWTNSAGGYWATAGNWQSGLMPGPGTNVDINASGTYTSTAQNTNACVNLVIGTTSGSGTQTLLIDSSVDSPLTCSNITVGARGVFSYADKCNVYGTGLVTVVSGGQLYRRSGQYQGDFHGHDIVVQGGGRWTVESNTTQTVYSDPGREVSYTVNGTLDGPGTMNCNNPGNRTWFTGTGRLDVAQITLNNNNGGLYLGGALTVNSAIIQSNAAGSAVVLTNGARITLNGPYIIQGASGALLVFTNTDNALVTGTNLISVRHDDNGSYGVFTGTKVGAAGGALTIAGSGALEVCQASTLNLEMLASVLNLQRNSRFWATTNAASIRPGSIIINANGPGTTMTMDTNIILRLWNSGIVLNVTNGASLALRNAIIEGGNNGAPLCTNVYVGCGSAGTLALRANSTNILRRSSESAYALCALLGSNATALAETGSVLQLQECHFAVGITNGSAWGWSTAGAIAVGTGTVFEAMNTDLGFNFPQGAADRSVKELRFQSPGNLTLTLSNDGSPDNDGDGITDSAVYVYLLDVSGMPGGATATLAGNGVASPRLYYRKLINPNNVTLGAGILAMPARGSVYTMQ